MMQLHLKDITQTFSMVEKTQKRRTEMQFYSQCFQRIYGLRKVAYCLKDSVSSHFKEEHFTPFLSPKTFMKI